MGGVSVDVAGGRLWGYGDVGGSGVGGRWCGLHQARWRGVASVLVT